MDNVITRHLLNANLSLTVYTGKQSVNHKLTALIPMINRAKTYLIKEKNCQVGQSVFLADIQWPSYLAWFFACAELGLNFIISDLPVLPDNFEFVGNRLKEKYGNIDYYVGSLEAGKALFGDVNDISRSVLHTYRDESMADVYRATPDTILLRSITSGTTGNPKLVTHTHEFFYKLMDRNANVYGLKATNKCLHTKILHHGSVIGVFFLPTLKYCARHFWINSTTNVNDVGNTVLAGNLASVIRDHGVDRVLLFYDMIDILYADLANSTRDPLTVYVLSPVKQEYINKMVGEYGYEIVSIFGCTESSGPLFLQHMTSENYQTFDKKNFGTALDDFYRITVNDSKMLTVEMPDGSVLLTGDTFEKVGDEFFFLGRANMYRINDEKVFPIELNMFLEQQLNLLANSDFDLVIDQGVEKIGIRVEQSVDLADLNSKIVDRFGPNYTIHCQINETRRNFMSGIKFDADLFRSICRERFSFKEIKHELD